MPDNIRHRKIFRECYNFLLTHLPASLDDAYWTRTAEDAGKVCGMLGGDPLAVDLLAAVYTELERMALSDETAENPENSFGDLSAGRSLDTQRR